MTGPGPVGFGERLHRAMAAHGPLCVGIDPHPQLLDRWGLEDDAQGLETFSMTVVEALTGHVAALKPQAAFFERHGSRGVAVLERVLEAAGEGGTQVVLDAKRGDIGSTMAGYADAYLRRGSPASCDALTVSPYLGFGSLGPVLEAASASGRGVFVLALTSNPEGARVQHARLDDGVSVAGEVARAAAALNAAERARTGAGLGSTGLVVGATVGSAARDLGLALEDLQGPVLAPGVGAQGAGRAELVDVFGAARRFVLASSSRAVLGAGPAPQALLDAARTAADEVGAALA
ncbi:orotidine-5'-phosphate decarboxylase [Cellulomonas bogoriensis]|uniref:Orotidine 5'-phosphate decarboxylase n=1 Tax=Cellulomonas bogoriensis 69B4 = DSM 16987 TaxID=1386082 RepID=A0A0A0C4J2_9CELL|nr:orotidine-5'-phosphate decarboxylase [Cellulomonas bogoriensis]KGM14239.1 orotidine 5'-phosphate decarboxylase [Cellulomonas bogoriensis 69B4 = DSM 16987]